MENRDRWKDNVGIVVRDGVCGNDGVLVWGYMEYDINNATESM